MTSSGKNGLNIRRNASPKWDRAKLHYDKHAGKELRDLYPGENSLSARHDGKWTAATVVEKHRP